MKLLHTIQEKYLELVFISALVFFIVPLSLSAQTVTSAAGDWETAGTWTGGSVPTGGDITIGHNVTVRTTTNFTGNITVSSGNTLTFSTGFTLTGDITVQSGATVTFTNTAASTIIGDITVNRTALSDGTLNFASNLSFVNATINGTFNLTGATNRSVTASNSITIGINATVSSAGTGVIVFTTQNFTNSATTTIQNVASITATGNFQNSGTIDFTTTNGITVSGNFTNNGLLYSDATAPTPTNITLQGTSNQTIANTQTTNYGSANFGTLTWSKTGGTATISNPISFSAGSSSSPTISQGNLTVANGGNVSFTGAATLGADLTIQNNGIVNFNDNTNPSTIQGDVTISSLGTLNCADDINFNSDVTINGTFNILTGATSDITLSVDGDLNIGSSATLTSADANDDLNIVVGQNFINSSRPQNNFVRTITCTGNFTNSGIIDFDSPNIAITVQGNFTNTGSLTATATLGIGLELEGNNDQTIHSTQSSSYSYFIWGKNNGTVTFSSNISFDRYAFNSTTAGTVSIATGVSLTLGNDEAAPANANSINSSNISITGDNGTLIINEDDNAANVFSSIRVGTLDVNRINLGNTPITVKTRLTQRGATISGTVSFLSTSTTYNHVGGTALPLYIILASPNVRVYNAAANISGTINDDIIIRTGVSLTVTGTTFLNGYVEFEQGATININGQSLTVNGEIRRNISGVAPGTTFTGGFSSTSNTSILSIWQSFSNTSPVPSIATPQTLGTLTIAQNTTLTLSASLNVSTVNLTGSGNLIIPTNLTMTVQTLLNLDGGEYSNTETNLQLANNATLSINANFLTTITNALTNTSPSLPANTAGAGNTYNIIYNLFSVMNITDVLSIGITTQQIGSLTTTGNGRLRLDQSLSISNLIIGPNTSLDVGSSSLTVTGNAAVDVGGSLVFGETGTLQLNTHSGTITGNGHFIYPAGGTGIPSGITNLASLTINSNYTLSSDLTIGRLNLGTNTLTINNRSLTVNGEIAGNGTIAGNSSSNLSIGGTGAISNFVTPTNLSMLKLDRDGTTLTLTRNLTISDTLDLVEGVLASTNNTIGIAFDNSATVETFVVSGSGSYTAAAPTGTYNLNYNTGSISRSIGGEIGTSASRDLEQVTISTNTTFTISGTQVIEGNLVISLGLNGSIATSAGSSLTLGGNLSFTNSQNTNVDLSNLALTISEAGNGTSSIGTLNRSVSTALVGSNAASEIGHALTLSSLTVGNGANTRTLNLSNPLVVNGSVTISANSSINVLSSARGNAKLAVIQGIAGTGNIVGSNNLELLLLSNANSLPASITSLYGLYVGTTSDISLNANLTIENRLKLVNSGININSNSRILTINGIESNDFNRPIYGGIIRRNVSSLTQFSLGTGANNISFISLSAPNSSGNIGVRMSSNAVPITPVGQTFLGPDANNYSVIRMGAPTWEITENNVANAGQISIRVSEANISPNSNLALFKVNAGGTGWDFLSSATSSYNNQNHHIATFNISDMSTIPQNSVLKFGELEGSPSFTTLSPDKAGSTTVTLKGWVRPNGKTLTVSFIVTQSGAAIPGSPFSITPSVTTQGNVFREITGLNPNTTYAYQIRVSYTESGNNYTFVGNEVEFSTTDNYPTQATLAVPSQIMNQTNPTAFKSTVSLNFNSLNTDVAYTIVYGTQADFSDALQFHSSTNISSGVTSTNIEINNLAPNTKYYAKAIVRSTPSRDSLFETSPVIFTTRQQNPLIQEFYTLNEDDGQARLIGRLLNYQQNTTVSFRFTSPSNPQGVLPSSFTLQGSEIASTFDKPVNNLITGITYTIEMVASTFGDGSNGEATSTTTFTIPAMSIRPDIGNINVINITSSTVNLGVAVEWRGTTANSTSPVRIQLSLDQDFREFSEGVVTGNYLSTFTNLVPSTGYYVRAIATNSDNRKDTSVTKQFRTSTVATLLLETTSTDNTSAQLNAKLTTDISGLEVIFYYSKTKDFSSSDSISYGGFSPDVTPTNSFVQQPVPISISDLAIGTRYYAKAYTKLLSPSGNQNVSLYRVVSNTIEFRTTVPAITSTDFTGLTNTFSLWRKKAKPSEYKQIDWRLIGLPGEKSGQNIQAILNLDLSKQGSEWQIFAYDPTSPADALYTFSNDDSRFALDSPGKGFWVVSMNQITLDASMDMPQIINSSIKIPVRKGWNIITNPFPPLSNANAINWNDVKTENNITSSLWEFNGTWNAVEKMRPYQGYYYYHTSDANDFLTIPASAFYSELSETANAPSSGTIGVNLDIKGKYKDNILFGISASSQSEIIHKPETVKNGYGISINSVEAAETLTLASDIKPFSILSNHRELVTWEFNVYSPQFEMASLSFSNVDQLPVGKALKVYNKETHQEVNIHNLHSFIAHKSRTTFVAVMGSVSDIDEHINKLHSNLKTGLEQNIPNPFGSRTSIFYSVSKESFVSLKVYDILGREVAVLVNKEKTPGKYVAEFNGDRFSSGRYFYRLISNGKVETKSMILAK